MASFICHVVGVAKRVRLERMVRQQARGAKQTVHQSWRNDGRGIRNAGLGSDAHDVVDLVEDKIMCPLPAVARAVNKGLSGVWFSLGQAIVELATAADGVASQCDCDLIKRRAICPPRPRICFVWCFGRRCWPWR